MTHTNQEPGPDNQLKPHREVDDETAVTVMAMGWCKKTPWESLPAAGQHQLREAALEALTELHRQGYRITR